jgi:Recombination endonuclease VII
MPRKDYEAHKQYMRDRYHHKHHGAPAPPVRTPMTPEEWEMHRKKYQAEYVLRPGVKEHRHDLELQRLYGITWEDKVRKYQDQRGLCGLCGLPLDPEISKAHVDHNHVTGEVRKLLHKQCNSIVAYFEEDSARINTLLDYLVR